MKAYTDLEQSKKLIKILPIESADMYWWSTSLRYYIEAMDDGDFNEAEGHIRAWSLAALLNAIPQIKLDSINQSNRKHWRCCSYFSSDWHNSEWYDNPVDACYEMIIKLHEQKLL